tara:strand:+ start:3523 stop:3987 length:465 start_codon:yes stop_codon:yes gene_type:complete
MNTYELCLTGQAGATDDLVKWVAAPHKEAVHMFTDLHNVNAQSVECINSDVDDDSTIDVRIRANGTVYESEAPKAWWTPRSFAVPLNESQRKSAVFAEALLSFLAVPMMYELDELEASVRSFARDEDETRTALCEAVLAYIEAERKDRRTDEDH